MNLFKFLLGSKANLSAVPVKKGNLVVATSTSNGAELYADSDTERVKLGYSMKEVDDKIALNFMDVDGTSITNFSNKLSVISTEEPLASTVVRTTEDGVLNQDLLPGAGLISGMQVRYLVPAGTTWTRSPEKCVTVASLPKAAAVSTEYTLPSPFGTSEAFAVVYAKNTTTGVWFVADTIYASSQDKTYGAAASCPGDGNVYLVTGNYFASSSYGTSAPRTVLLSAAEIVVALYCQKVEVTATHIVGARQKYLVAPGSAWSTGEATDKVILSDMPLTFSGNTPAAKKFVSPFGNKPVKLESWVLFAGQWRKEHMFFYNGVYYGHTAACPGDGYIYFNYGTFPQNGDSTGALANVPVGNTVTDGGTYTQYQVCLVATVHEEVDLPTVSAKQLAEMSKIDINTVNFTNLITIGTVSAPVYVPWYAPGDGFVVLNKSSSDGATGAVRLDLNGTALGLCRVNENANPQVISTQVFKDQKYTMYRTGSGVTFTFVPIIRDSTQLVLSDKVTAYGLRVGEVRHYSSLDTGIAGDTRFVNVSSSVQVDTTKYPEFAALVGVTGAYSVPAAASAGAGTIPYLYLGTKTA